MLRLGLGIIGRFNIRYGAQNILFVKSYMQDNDPCMEMTPLSLLPLKLSLLITLSCLVVLVRNLDLTLVLKIIVGLCCRWCRLCHGVRWQVLVHTGQQAWIGQSRHRIWRHHQGTTTSHLLGLGYTVPIDRLACYPVTTRLHRGKVL